MKVAPDLFEVFLKCPTKCWLRATGESASGNAYAEWVKEQNKTFRAAEADRLLAQNPPAASALSPPAENLKTAKWRLGLDIAVVASDLRRSSRREEAHSSVPQPSTLNPQPTIQSLVTSAATAQESATPPTFTAETRLHAVERVPLGAELVKAPSEWHFNGAVVPGYPTLHPLQDDFWRLFRKLHGQAKDPDAGNIQRPPIS